MLAPKLEESIKNAVVNKVGEATNELKIRISGCQLGCFK